MGKAGIITLILLGLTLAGCQTGTPPEQATTEGQTTSPPASTSPVSTPPTTTIQETSPPVSTAPPQKIPVGVSINNQAPDFTLATLAGDNITLSELRGKPVMLNFWATWCGPCRAEMPLLQQIHDKWSPNGLVLLEINWRDKPATVQQFMKDLNLSMNVPLDSDGQVSKTYLIGSIPTTFFIDKDGIIRQKFVGAFPSVEFIENQLATIIPRQISLQDK